MFAKRGHQNDQKSSAEAKLGYEGNFPQTLDLHEAGPRGPQSRREVGGGRGLTSLDGSPVPVLRLQRPHSLALEKSVFEVTFLKGPRTQVIGF